MWEFLGVSVGRALAPARGSQCETYIVRSSVMSRQSHMSFLFESVKFLLNADPPKLLFFKNAVFFTNS